MSFKHDLNALSTRPQCHLEGKVKANRTAHAAMNWIPQKTSHTTFAQCQQRRKYTRKKFGEVRLCDFQVMRADGQTNRHTHHNILCPSQGRSNKTRPGKKGKGLGTIMAMNRGPFDFHKMASLQHLTIS